MNNINDVAALIEQNKTNGVPLSDAAWSTALACVGWAYVFGAWGEECTVANRKRRYREDKPTIKTACKAYNGGTCSGCKWFPDGIRTRIFDCRGFTDWVLKQYGIDLTGDGATSQWNSDNWTAKGVISDCPDDILVCLFVKDGSTMSHTGFGYHGETVECSAGVQHFAKRKAKWTHWAIPKGIDGNIPKPTLRRGSKGEFVTLAQTELIQKGYDCGAFGADGQFGAATEKAVKLFQRDNGLTADGVIGSKTWAALDSVEPMTKYTVTIPHLSKSQADALISQHPGATMTEERG